MLKIFKGLILTLALFSVFALRTPSVERAFADARDPYLTDGCTGFCLNMQPMKCNMATP